MTNNPMAKQTDSTKNRFQLGQISQQGQYVNQKTGHLLIVDSKIESVLKNGPDLFNCFIAKNQAELEFTRVSENPKMPIEDLRTATKKLNLPVHF